MALLRAAHDGYEIKSMGDGFMLVFGSALDGLRCAVGMLTESAGEFTFDPAREVELNSIRGAASPRPARLSTA